MCCCGSNALGDVAIEYTELASARAITATLVLVALWSLEGAWPMFAGRNRRTAGYARNLGLGLLNTLLVSILAGALLLAVTAWAEANDMGLLRWLALPAVVAIPLAFILLDLWQYAWHRLNHRLPLLWRFHAVHHSDAEMTASTAVRFHTGELLLSTVARAALLPLLGLSMTHLALYELILFPIILFHHANVRVPARLDRALRLVIVTPWMHWVHHSQWQPETDSNYASVFSFWDRIFGSFRLRENPAEIALGLDHFEEAEWKSLRGMLATPFAHDFRKRPKD